MTYCEYKFVKRRSCKVTDDAKLDNPEECEYNSKTKKCLTKKKATKLPTTTKTKKKATSTPKPTPTPTPKPKPPKPPNPPKEPRDKLPPNWKIVESKNQPGLFFYYNKKTGVSTFNKPKMKKSLKDLNFKRYTSRKKKITEAEVVELRKRLL